MKQPTLIKVLDAWTITGPGIIAEFACQGNGLAQGNALKSHQSRRLWRLESRVKFSHVGNDHKSFPGETEKITWSAFGSSQDLESSRSRILEKESQGVFQYQLTPIDHKEKPMVDDWLEIVVES